MPGLNYGSSFKMKKPMAEGVSFAEKIGKWVVRVNKNGTLSTMAQFNTEVEANIKYEELITKTNK